MWISFLGFRVSFSSRKLVFFQCYCLAQQKSPSARGYGHDRSSLGRQDLRNAPGAHQEASGFCCLGRAGQGGGVFRSFHRLFKLFGSRQPEGDPDRRSAAELIRCICSIQHAKPVPRCKIASFTPLLAAPNGCFLLPFALYFRPCLQPWGQKCLGEGGVTAGRGDPC